MDGWMIYFCHKKRTFCGHAEKEGQIKKFCTQKKSISSPVTGNNPARSHELSIDKLLEMGFHDELLSFIYLFTMTPRYTARFTNGFILVDLYLLYVHFLFYFFTLALAM